MSSPGPWPSRPVVLSSRSDADDDPHDGPGERPDAAQLEPAVDRRRHESDRADEDHEQRPRLAPRQVGGALDEEDDAERR